MTTVLKREIDTSCRNGKLTSGLGSYSNSERIDLSRYLRWEPEWAGMVGSLPIRDVT